MTIHREGRTILFVLLIVLVSIIWAFDYFLPELQITRNIVIGVSLVLYFLILQFFRSPSITIEKNPKHILAPADGKVVVIEEVDEPEYLQRKCKQVSVFMSPVNVHVNRMPAGGTISYYRYHPGKYLVAWHPKSSSENERTTVVVKTDSGTEILFRQIAGALARRIKCYVNEGQKLEQGAEFGFIKFGSRVDVFLPADAVIQVRIGDKTTGGKTVIAHLD